MMLDKIYQHLPLLPESRSFAFDCPWFRSSLSSKTRSKKFEPSDRLEKIRIHKTSAFFLSFDHLFRGRVMAVRGSSNGGKYLMTVLIMCLLATEFCFAETADNIQLNSPESTLQNDETSAGVGGDHMNTEIVKTTISDYPSAEEDEEAVIRKLTEFREKKRQVRSASQAGTALDSELEEERRRYEAAEKAVRDVSMQFDILAQFIFLTVMSFLRRKP
jgi:hypothetical protein